MPEEKNLRIFLSLILGGIFILIVYIVWANYFEDSIVDGSCDISGGCIATTTENGWLTKTDSDTNLTFEYPKTLGTTYTTAIDWPPLFQVVGPYTCVQAGSVTSSAGLTQERNIGGVNYCITLESQGAAGSIYSLYAFAFAKQLSGKNQTVIMTFSIKEVQCANYPSPKKEECQTERASFNIDSIASQIAQSVR